MNSKWLITGMLMLNLAQAQNYFSDAVTKVVKKTGLVNFLFERGACPEDFKQLPPMPAEEILSKALELRGKRKDCESAKYFLELRRQWPVKPYIKMAWKEEINSYVLAGDYTAAINEGNDFLDQMLGTPEAEEVHLILINSVNTLMKQAGAERNQEWTEYALGISRSQNDENPFLKNLSFKSFIDKYPNSPNIKTIQAMTQNARNNHAEYQLNVGNFYALQNSPSLGIPNYPAALLRYDIILKWGPVVSSFNQALFSTVDVLYKMKRIIQVPGSISESDLKMWLRVDSLRDKNTVDRLTLIKQIDGQIAELQKKMNSETITQDIWTQKTKNLIAENQK